MKQEPAILISIHHVPLDKLRLLQPGLDQYHATRLDKSCGYEPYVVGKLEIGGHEIVFFSDNITEEEYRAEIEREGRDAGRAIRINVGEEVEQVVG